MNNSELTDYILKPENRQYVEISLSRGWGLSTYIAESNGLKYVHRGTRQIDEKILITKEWKNKSYAVDDGLLNFLQNFSDDELSRQKLDLEKIVKGQKKITRSKIGFFVGFMIGGMNLLHTDMLKNNDNNAYYVLAASGALIAYGIYSAITMNGKKTREYSKFLDIINAAENVDYFVHKNISKDFLRG